MGKNGERLGRSKFRNWQRNLARRIQSDCRRLKNFRSKDLIDVDLNKFESDIKECYESFRKTIGPIAAGKILHIICPNFFPLWDNDIAKAVRNECSEDVKKDNGVEEFSGADYYKFMQVIQNFVKKYEKILSDLCNKYKKGKLKILDECLWWATHRPLFLFF